MKPVVSSRSRLPYPLLFILIPALVATVRPNALAEIRYSIIDLGATGGSASTASDINDRGQVAGDLNIGPPGASRHPFLYSGGQMIDLGTLGGTYTYTYGINNSGHVVGEAQDSRGIGHAFLYAGSGLTVISGLDSAHAINNSGQVAGSSWTGSATHGFLYSGGTLTDIGGLPGYRDTRASDINDNGQIAGYVSDTTGAANRAFLYSGGSMIDLGTLGGTGALAVGINQNGQVVGWARTGISTYYHAFVYSGGEMTDLGTLGGSWSVAYGINDYGQVVGNSYTSSVQQHAFVYDGDMKDLNNLIDPSLGWTLQSANAINDSGQIAGSGVNASGQYHAFLLNPIPEPASVALLALGGAAFFFKRKAVR